ncbi:MAG: PHB depolymerase family esterase [Mycobacteriaceae bacterium]
MKRFSALAAALVIGGIAASPASADPIDPPGMLTVGGLQRTYLVHAPAGAAQAGGLVINLHGAGMNGQQQADLTDYNTVADRYGFVVAYPDGIDATWADGRGASVPDRQGVDDVGFLSALIERLSHDYGIPAGHVFVTGMSAGAFMANRLVCERADLVTAIAPVAGTLGAAMPCSPSRPVSVMAVHGTADPVVPYGGGVMNGRGGPSDIVSAPALAERWREMDRCPGPLLNDPGATGEVQEMTATGCADNTVVILVSINGGGHTWPAGRFSLPVEVVGPTSFAVNASAATAQFFAAALN